MSIGTELDAFGALATALGILDSNGNANDAWFADPVGTSTNPNGLAEILASDTQRDALLSFVDEVLGAPDRSTRGGATWVPLFHNASPLVTIFAVIKPVANAVYIGVGFEHDMGGAAPKVATRVHVPIFRVQRGTTPLSGGGGLPEWLLLGRADGRIDINLDLTLRDDAPPAGQPSLGALAVTLGIPTDGTANLHLALELRDLQLPGGTSTRTVMLDAATPDQLGAEVLELLATLVRAQVDALTSVLPQEVAGLLGLLGLTDVKNLVGQQAEGSALVGQKVLIGGKSMTVIGVFKSKGTNGFQDQDSIAVMPLTTAREQFVGNSGTTGIVLVAGTESGTRNGEAIGIEAILLYSSRGLDVGEARHFGRRRGSGGRACEGAQHRCARERGGQPLGQG